jgi:hypothetical protein
MSLKKGAVISSTDPRIVTKIKSLEPKWYYTWGPTAVLGLEDVPFTAMCWGSHGAPQKGVNAPVLLGFNEPDRTDQSNLSPAEALNLWPLLVAPGRRLGSPATAANPAKPGSWLEQFMAGSPHVDFICVHWYAPPNVNAFLNQIDAIYAKYKLPIWVTEFAVADWTGKYPGGYEVSLVETFMKGACAGLDARDYVERYTWKTRGTSDANLGTSALFKDDGSLTALGRIYESV